MTGSGVPTGVGRTIAARALRTARGLAAAAALAGLLAGLPWAAWHWVGWPLPHRIPDWQQTQAVLSQPTSTALLVDVLTCVGWMLWAAFTVDVGRCVAATVAATGTTAPTEGWRRFPTVGTSAGPIQTVAATLVGTVVLTLLSARPGTPSAPLGPSTPAVPRAEAVAGSSAAVAELPSGWTAPHRRPQTTPSTRPSTGPSAELPTGRPAAPRAGSPVPDRSPVVVVRGPNRGIHDSLWRIADRNLRDGTRWPEIYQLNKGHRQPDGQRLISPNLIYPGWRLELPTTGRSPAPDEPRSSDSGDNAGSHGGSATPTPPPTPPPAATDPTRTPAAPAPSASAPSTTPNGTSASAASAPAATPAPTPTSAPGPSATSSPSAGHSPGVDLPGGGYLGLGLAGLLTAAALTLRQWRLTHPAAAGQENSDMDIAPVVRALRVAHADAADADFVHHGGTSLGSTRDVRHTGPADRSRPTTNDHQPSRPEPALEGTRDGLTRSVELARTRGLGVIGEGAPAATRALLVALLAARHRPPHHPADDPTDAAAAGPIEVLIPADALDSVLPGLLDTPGRSLPARLRVTRDLDTALDMAETELLTRARLSAERRTDLGTLVILAVPQHHARQRLQAVLDNGSTLGVAGILLGQWQPGGTVRVRSDGTIAAASPDITASLDQARLFTLPTDSTRTLLDLLAAADVPAEHTDALHHTEALHRTEALHHTDPRHPAHPNDADTDTAADDTVTSPDGDAPDIHRPDGATEPARPRRPEGDHLTVIRTNATVDPPSPTAQHAKPDGARAATALPADRTASVLRPVPPTRTKEAISQDPGDLDLDPDRTNLELAPAVGGSTTRPSEAPARGPFSEAGRRHQPGSRPASPHPASGGVIDKMDLWRPSAALRLTVLGRLQLQHRPPAGRTRAASIVDVIGALAPRQREVLVYLALNPDGARRESLAAAIWPDAPVDRPYNSFHATLSQLRKALSKAIDDSTTRATGSSASSTTTSTVGRLILHGDGRYRLDRDLVDVDLWHLSDTLATARSTAPDRLDALRRVPELYRGDLAEDLTAEWLAARRETLRRQVLDALSTLVHSVPGDPRQVLVWLDQARDLDPYNEAIYQDLIRTHARLGQRDAIVRTLDLLATTLTDIDRRPAPTTLALAESLAAPRSSHRESE